jgi:hypothetical protein
MMELSSLGGMFDLRDKRSTGMYNSLNSGLSGGNDFNKAMNLQVLRGIKPEAGMLDLLQMEEEGMGGENGSDFLKGTLGMYSQMFGDDKTLAIMSMKARWPDIPYSQLRRLAEGEDIIGTMDTESKTKVDYSGQGNVTRRSEMQAEVTDAWAVGVISGMNQTKTQMAEIMADAMRDAMRMVSDSLDGAKSSNAPRVNPLQPSANDQ